MALVVMHHLLTVEEARIDVAASSRDQARILHEAAESFARQLGNENIVFRHLELRALLAVCLSCHLQLEAEKRRWAATLSTRCQRT